jgi:hypothetical protein
MSFADYRISDHARLEMGRRGIPEEVLQTVLTKPEQVIETSSGRRVLQGRIQSPDVAGAKLYLVRAVVDPAEEPPLVITVYRTSKLQKYWRAE